jgi:hypothetical protein
VRAYGSQYIHTIRINQEVTDLLPLIEPVISINPEKFGLATVFDLFSHHLHAR